MLLVIALVAMLLAAWFGRRYWQLVADGATAPALDIRVERQVAGGRTVVGDPYRYLASYAFVDAAGRRHTSTQTIARDLYERLAHGGEVALTVHYSRAQPGVNVIDLDAARYVPLILAALAAVTWIAALVRLLRG